MKKAILLLFIGLTFYSCNVLYGPNTLKLVQQLELGMSKQEAIKIMGKDYFLESAYQTEEGKMEILHFKSTNYPNYLLYFLNGELTEFHRYISTTPIQQEVKIIKENE